MEKPRSNKRYIILPSIFIIALLLVSELLLWKIAPTNLFIWETFYWSIPGTASYIIQIICIKYIRDKSSEIYKSLRDFLPVEKYEKTKEYHLILYKRPYYLIIAIAMAVFAVIFETYYVIIEPHSWWVIYYNRNFLLANARAIFTIILFGVGFFVLGTFFSFIFGNLYILNRICRNIVNVNVFHPDKLGGLSFLTGFSKSIIVSWLPGTLLMLPTLIFVYRAWWTILPLSFYLIVSLVILFFTTYPFHRKLVKAKKDILEKVGSTLSNRVLSVTLDMPNKKSRKILEKELNLAVSLNKLLNLFGHSIDAFETWPFGLKTSVSSVLGAATPIALKLGLLIFQINLEINI